MTFEEAIGQLKCNVEGDYINLDDLEAFNLAIPALEKQIPKKPILDTIFPSGVKWYLCPACNHNGIEKVGGYCHSCGQALDWSDTE